MAEWKMENLNFASSLGAAQGVMETPLYSSKAQCLVPIIRPAAQLSRG